jgi:hypothetical protein
MAQIHGKQIRDTTITPAKAKIAGETWDFGAGILRAADPAAPTDVVNRQYMENFLEGFTIKDACRLATAAALDAYTAAGSGVGKTITINATGDLTIDGVKVLVQVHDSRWSRRSCRTHARHGL